MVEQVDIHVVVIRLMIRFCNREVLIQVESHHVFETDLLVFVHSDQLTIHTQR